MAITPPSDIVLDVARAADPERYRAAVERLTNLRAARAAAQPSSSPAAGEPVATPVAAVAEHVGPSPRAPLQNRRRLDAFGQFEAFVLQSFVQSMLPKNATNVYGRGTAGEVWRSMLAEKMGEQLARSGQVGIARQLEAGARARATDAGDAQTATVAQPASSAPSAREAEMAAMAPRAPSVSDPQPAPTEGS